VGQNDPQAPESVEFTDDTITLRPLRPADAAAHLAGEDDELVEWLNGGVSTPTTVRAHIDRATAMWAADGPIFNFGIRTAATDTRVGTIDVQLGQPYAADNQANLAFGPYPPWGAWPSDSSGAVSRALPRSAHPHRGGTDSRRPPQQRLGRSSLASSLPTHRERQQVRRLRVVRPRHSVVTSGLLIRRDLRRSATTPSPATAPRDGSPGTTHAGGTTSTQFVTTSIGGRLRTRQQSQMPVPYSCMAVNKIAGKSPDGVWGVVCDI
jgi:hypothetical protein